MDIDGLDVSGEGPPAPYEPGADRNTATFDYAYFAAAKAFALRDTEGSYSEESIRCFQECFRTHFTAHLDIGAEPVLDNPNLEEARRVVSFFSLYKRAYHDHDTAAKSALADLFTENGPPISVDDLQSRVEPFLSKIEEACSNVALQSMVGLHLSKIRALDHNWQDALRMYAHSLACFDAVTREPDFGEDAFRKRNWREAYEYSMWDEWDRYGQQTHKEALEAFTHLRGTSGSGIAWQEVSKHVQMIIKAMEYSEHLDPDFSHRPHWMEIQGWLRGAKLEPGELRDELRLEEDEKAEQRLRKYFFDNAQWRQLPEQAQRSLVEADRVWFSSQCGNPGTALESIKIAVESVMYELFWKPCFDWIDKDRLSGPEVLDVLVIRNDLQKQNRNPSLFQFESIVESKGLASYLRTLDISDTELAFVRKFRRPLESLRQTRLSVAHNPGGLMLTHEQVAPLYKKFLGLGEEGILPRLAKIKARLDRRASVPTIRR